MAAFSTTLLHGIRSRLKEPVLWYGVYLTLVAAGFLAVTLSPLPTPPSQDLVSFAALLATLPPVGLIVCIASRMPVTPRQRRSALANTGKWTARLVGSGVTFALGAFIATLVALDLDRVDIPASVNRYFYSFLGLVFVSVSLIALAGVVIQSAWMYFRADDARVGRAAVRALTSKRSREALPLRVRIWLDDADQEPTPDLATIPTVDSIIRALTPVATRGCILTAALLFVFALSSHYPAVIRWIS